MRSEILNKSILVFGCGNILLGDDGFGPKVVQYLQGNFHIPENVLIMDVGTGIRDILFDILIAERRPKRIIIVDAVNYENIKPGEVFEIPVEGIPESKTHDFSLHQHPTINLLKGLKYYTQTEVIIIVVQVEKIPEEIEQKLSTTVESAIPKACNIVFQLLFP